MTTHARRPKPHPATTLDADEQAELALKIRYGIGLEQLMGEVGAREVRATTRLPAPAHKRQTEPATAPSPEPARSDDEIRARAAALGVQAGRRGQWMR